MQEKYNNEDILLWGETSGADIFLRIDGIIHVDYKPNTYLDAFANEEIRLKIIEFARGIKRPVIYTAHAGLVITREARENSRSKENVTPISMEAMVTNNIVYQILAEFYRQAYKPSIPFKVFEELQTAMDWIATLRDLRSDSASASI